MVWRYINILNLNLRLWKRCMLNTQKPVSCRGCKKFPLTLHIFLPRHLRLQNFLQFSLLITLLMPYCWHLLNLFELCVKCAEKNHSNQKHSGKSRSLKSNQTKIKEWNFYWVCSWDKEKCNIPHAPSTALSGIQFSILNVLKLLIPKDQKNITTLKWRRGWGGEDFLRHYVVFSSLKGTLALRNFLLYLLV